MRGVLLGGAAVAAAVGLFVSGMVVAGPLDPPAGAPAPTYKTLAEVEPRIAVQSLAGSSSWMHIIDEPGSYYLTGNIHVPAGKSGIAINPENVTLDLNGFSIIGEADSSFGVSASLNNGTVIRNGAILNMGLYGISVGDRARIEDVRIDGADEVGILCGDDALISGCTISNGRTTLATGIRAGDRCVIVNCVSTNNASFGIQGGHGSTIQGCTANGNGQSGVRLNGQHGSVIACTANGNARYGIESVTTSGGIVVRDCTTSENEIWGINVQTGSTVAGCVANGNGAAGGGGGIRVGPSSVVSACTATANTGAGFLLGNRARLADATATSNTGHGVQGVDAAVITGSSSHSNLGDGFSLRFGASIERCTARNNTGDGIEVSSGAQVVGNTCDTNGLDAGLGAGIAVIGNACRIEGNHLVNNDWAINFTATLNSAFRNSFKFNSVNIQGGAGNDVAPFGNAATATSAWANLQL